MRSVTRGHFAKNEIGGIYEEIIQSIERDCGMCMCTLYVCWQCICETSREHGRI